MKKVFVLIALLALSGCSYINLDDVKDNAEARFDSLGFDIVGYDGFQWGFGVGDYGGARVWYILKKKNDNSGITYGGALQRWGDEYHFYNLKAYDAIRP